MRQAKRASIITLLCVLMLVCLLPTYASAAESSGTIKVLTNYGEEHTPIPGVKLAVYPVAELDMATGKITVAHAFSASGVTPAELNDATTATVEKLDAFVAEKQPSPAASAASDSAGRASFELADGIYLIRQENTPEDFEGKTVVMESFLVSLPTKDDSGNMTRRTLECKPKIDVEEETEPFTLRVYKYWADNSNSAKKRPSYIEVQLYGNDALIETVRLTAENNWTYFWEKLNPGVKYTVKEGELPKGYTDTVKWLDENTVTITNTYTPEKPGNPNPPKTGDDTNLTLWYVLMAVSGCSFLACVLSIYREKKMKQ